MNRHFLHLSDLHFRHDWPEETALIVTRLMEDITSEVKKFPDAYLIFSGDLVQAGGDPDIYKAFNATFDTALSKAGFPFDRRICIPGNHDVSRPALSAKTTLQLGVLSAMVDEATFNNNVSILSEHYFSPTFTPYRAYEKMFAKYTCCASEIGGCGWDMGDGLGIYCLNTALCSFGGLNDSQGKTIVDKGRLLIDTRGLYRWIQSSNSTTRLLVMHHPTDHLAEWAKEELGKIVASEFHIVISGHVHAPSATLASTGVGGSVHCVSPALFTRKSETLGYSFVTVTDSSVDIAYRQWTPSYKFVAGAVFAGNDEGVKRFPRSKSNVAEAPTSTTAAVADGVALLQEEFDEAITSYSSKKKLWVERDLAAVPETAKSTKNARLTTSEALASTLRSVIVRAPKQYGLTCLGRFLALRHSKNAGSMATAVMMDATDVSSQKHGLKNRLRRRCAELQTTMSSLSAVILDNWHNDKASRLMLAELKSLLPTVSIVLLQSMDTVSEFLDAQDIAALADFECLYLWSMNRSRIRELVASYIEDLPSLEEYPATKKVIDEIDSLNLHRTPLNCLTILKLVEQVFDESPVNRTEMIGRVLQMLFFNFQEIPRYNARPDLKDCEHALGALSEWLIRSGRSSFTREDFFDVVKGFSSAQIIDLDSELLLSFLITENIVVRRNTSFEFRFGYWMHFFAAHRMHHSPQFASFILGQGRYAAYPEMIEFYTGIDRQREDAVRVITSDLRAMNSDFVQRTKIADDFDPWRNAQWVPTQTSVERMLKEVTDNAAESALPIAVKDAIADQHYDRSKPYRQELAQFLADSSLEKMISTVRGAARALRNSDYVDPELKIALMEEVVCCWRRVAQILAVLSPLLSAQRRASFEGMNFVLDESFDDADSDDDRINRVLTAIPSNIVDWYQDDIFSRKMGTLFSRYINSHRGTLNEALILSVLVTQRSPGWDREVEAFIERSKKNSYYLLQIFVTLLSQFKTSITNERTRQQLRRLTAMTVAKHDGVKNLGSKAIESKAKELDKQIE